MQVDRLCSEVWMHVGRLYSMALMKVHVLYNRVAYTHVEY